jgi:amidohydrolase
MIADGVLENPKVDAAFGVHLWNEQPVGTIGVTEGPQMAAVDLFRAVIKGRGGHAAIPHDTIDAVVVASHIVTALQTVVSRRISPLHPAVVTVASIHAGTGYNIIPEEAVLEGTVRSFDDEAWEALPGMVESTVNGICKTFGAAFEWTYDRMVPPTVNDPKMAALVRESAVEVVREAFVVPEREVPTMGGEDFGFFLKNVPGCFAFVGSRNESKGLMFGHHNPRFDIDEGALPIGVELLMNVAEKYLRSHSI